MATENTYRQQLSGADSIDDLLSPLSPTQEMALYLYNLGLNVFPQPFGKKAGLPWKQLQYTRLHPDDPTTGIQALFAGECNIAILCGRTSGNLFIIDCESILALNTHIGHLRQRSIPLWISRTSRGGHIYLHCSEGEVANIESGILRDTEIRGNRGYVLAPGSLHPTGVVYQWLSREGDRPPTVSIHDINWLHDTTGKPVRLKLTQRQHSKKVSFNPLSRATQDYLNNGHSLSEGNRNNRLFSAACDMAGNGHALHHIRQQLTPIASSSGLPTYEIHTTLDSAFSRERKPARPWINPAPKKQSTLWQHARTFAENHQWEGRSSTTDKLVFLALTERARSANENGVFRASIREISVLARTSLNPVKKALKRLRESQLIFYAGEDKTSSAFLWRFSSSVIRQGQEKSDSSPAAPPWKSWSESLFHSTDAAERGALGYSGLMVYQTLLERGEAVMPTALALHMGVPVHRVSYALRKLKMYGLVDREAEGWRALTASSAELDERVARVAGKLGRGAARRESYARQRALYVGQIILRARLDHFRESFLAQPRELQLNAEDSAPLLQIWRCPNCGQQYFGDLLPETCDFCADLTTWQPMSEAARLFDDPLVRIGILELGGVLGPP